MGADANLRPNPNVAFRELAGSEGGVLLHLDSGEYHGINALGCLIWGLLDGERSEADIVEQVRLEVDDAPQQLEDDVRSFLDDLRRRDLIVG